MLTFNNFEVDLRSIPGEICLTFYICDCPCHCKGCSSPWLWQPGKRELTLEKIKKAIELVPYITCVLFMGGDNDPETVFELGEGARSLGRKAAWYSGRALLDEALPHLDYYKVGPWIEEAGPLTSPTTNQILYQIEEGKLRNITPHFWTAQTRWRPQQEEQIIADRAEWFDKENI